MQRYDSLKQIKNEINLFIKVFDKKSDYFLLFQKITSDIDSLLAKLDKLKRQLENYIQKAIDDLSRAIELNPKDFKAFKGREDSYAQLGQYQKAIEDYNQAILLNPKFSAAYNNHIITAGVCMMYLENIRKQLKTITGL